MMNNNIKLILFFIILNSISIAQNWQLKLSSNVYLRTWKLDTKATKEENVIGGATIILYQNNKQIAQTTSNSDGEFTIMVPPNGNFYLSVSYAGCNTKRMAVNTEGVPNTIFNDNSKPSFKITGGFIMVKPYPGINYSELSQDLIRVEYLSNKKAFDDTPEGTDKGLSIVSKIYSAEDDLFKRFCTTNKEGDVALAKPDCPLAKMLYEKAIAMIPGEQYPVIQLAKVGLCLKDKAEAEKKAIEAKKAEEKKTLADKENKEKAALEKAEADKIAKEKNLVSKAEIDKTAKEKAEADKTAKQKANQEKTEAANNQTQELQAEEKAIEEKRLAKKLEKEKAAQEKAQKQKEGLAKVKAEELAEDEARAKKRAADEAEKERLAYETKQKDSDPETGHGNSKYSIPQKIGVNKYKETITKADDDFKFKRYKEAKINYQEALKQKPNDAYAIKKIADCDVFLNPK